MNFADFIRKVKLGFIKRQFIYSSVILFTVLYALVPPSVTKLFILLSIAFTAQITLSLFVKRLRPQLEYLLSRKKPKSIEIPEIRNLARQMNVKLAEKAFWLTESKNIYAQINDSGKILFGDPFYSKLKRDERVFVGGHELTHAKEKHYLWLVLSGSSAGVATFVALMSLGVPQDIGMFAGFAAMILATNFIGRKLEYKADIGGVRFVSPDIAESAIRKAYDDEGMDFNSDTHPSGNSRLKNLRKFYRKQQSK